MIYQQERRRAFVRILSENAGERDKDVSEPENCVICKREERKNGKKCGRKTKY